MLTPADQALWQQFLKEADTRKAEFADADMVPIVLVCARVRQRHDDHAWIGFGPGDVGVQARGDVTRYNLAALLKAAADFVLERGTE